MPPPTVALRSLARRDPALGRAMRRVAPYPGFPQRGRGAPGSRFHALARAIIFQQLAGAAARTIHARVAALTPGPRFPSPDELSALPEAALRAAGLSRGKLASLRDLAARVGDGRLRLRGMHRLDDDDVIERLVEVRGIGEWTAQMFLMFELGRLDVMPTGDLGVREGMRRLDGLAERPTPTALDQRAQIWAPLRSVGAWVLWRLADE